MKTILVLTDFSPIAQHAADAAVILAGKLKTDIILLNSFMTIPLIPSDEAASWQVQEYFQVQNSSKAGLESEKERLEARLKDTQFEPGKPSIRLESRFGMLTEIVKELIEIHSVEMIIMGGRGKNDMPFLFGDTIKSVINHIKRPVLIVPRRFNPDKLADVTFATDLDDDDLKSVKALAHLGVVLKFNIHVAHVMEPVVVADFREEAETSNFRKAVNDLKIAGLTYQTIYGEDITAQLEKFNRTSHAGLLAMVHKKHSFLWRLFNEQPCQQMIKHHLLPLLIYAEPH